MALRNYSPIIEFPGVQIGGNQYQVICRRYALAADFAADRAVLEVGCGPGLGLGVMAKRARFVVGGDVTARAFVAAGRTYAHRRNIRVLGFDAHVLPFAAGSFDLVLALATICYLDADRFLSEVRRVLRPSGAFVFDTPNRDAPGFRPSPFSTRYLSVPELTATLQRSGFTVTLWAGFPVARGWWGQGLVAAGDEALGRLGMGREIRERIRQAVRRVVGLPSYRLPPELTEDQVNAAGGAPLVAIASEEPDTAHAVIYGRAQVNST